MPVLTVDAHATIIEGALKGFGKWRSARAKNPDEVRFTRRDISPSMLIHVQEYRVTLKAAEGNFESWCGSLLEMNFEVCHDRNLDLVTI